MAIDFKALTSPLTVDELDFRIQSINKGGYATILVYKDARVDINRLNSACGHLNWERKHTRDNHNCVVSIWDDDKKLWVSKEDTGTESNTEKEKGLASDSFKRACFNWGIGVELYDYPLIQVKLNGDGANQKDEWFIQGDKPKQGWGLKLKQWMWIAEHNEDGTPSFLQAIDDLGKVRFSYGHKNNQQMITITQAKELNDLILEKNSNKDNLIAYYKVDSIEDMTQKQFNHAKQALEKK